jgi:hypothetical protein
VILELRLVISDWRLGEKPTGLRQDFMVAGKMCGCDGL